jgi:hypothetical protein
VDGWLGISKADDDGDATAKLDEKTKQNIQFFFYKLSLRKM